MYSEPDWFHLYFLADGHRLHI